MNAGIDLVLVGYRPPALHAASGLGLRVLLVDAIAPSEPSGLAWLRRGIIDRGMKDTVLVLPGEEVQVLGTFDAHKGLFLYHCHNLEHEDMGMMRNFRIS